MQTKHLCVLIHIWTKNEVGAPWDQFMLPVKYCIDRFKALLLLWIIYVISVLFLLCFRMPCGHLLGKRWPLESRSWCLIVSMLLSHMVPWAMCGTWLYRFLISALFLTLIRLHSLILRVEKVWHVWVIAGWLFNNNRNCMWGKESWLLWFCCLIYVLL